MKICACLAEETPRSCIRAAKALGADLVEHRMDFMRKIEHLDEIYSAIKVPIIATNRPVAYMGHFKGTEEERAAHLLSAIDAGCAMVDIELETDNILKRQVISAAKGKGCKVIISMHDFSGTPGNAKLLDAMHSEQRQGADIGKIVTTARSLEDCHRVLGLLLKAREEKFPLVAFAMGKLGKFTRPLSLLFGAPFTFASAGKKTAPGQPRISELRAALWVLS